MISALNFRGDRAMHRVWGVLLALGSLLAVSTDLAAQEPARLALLIGNAGYSGKIQPLKNPHNDIVDVGKALSLVGFKVTTLADVERRQMLSAVKTFAAELAKLGPNAVGFLYYSGHGVARPEDHANYLIPVDLKDTGSTDFWFDAVKLDDILGELERAAPFAAHFVVFDACRDELKLPYKSASKGFEAVAERSGMFIAFATALGAVALDEGKTNRSGPYASALAAELVKPGQDHLQLFQNVKEDVFGSTAHRQVPWERNGLLRRIYFGGELPAARPGAQPTQSQASEAERAWLLVKDTENMLALDAFTRRFGDTFYGDLAKARLADLQQQSEAVRQRAAQKKSDDALAKAEADRQHLAMLQQHDEDKRSVEAEAAKKQEPFSLAREGGATIIIEGTGDKIYFDSKQKSAIRDQLGIDFLSKHLQKHFVEGIFSAVHHTGASEERINGIGGITPGELPGQSRIFLVETYSTDVGVAQFDKRERRYAVLSIVSQQGKVSCQLTDWQKTANAKMGRKPLVRGGSCSVVFGDRLSDKGR
jgi:uncharacterized caspase-like protein